MQDRKAVALKYIEELPAPFIAAKGKGRIAERILEIAREEGVLIEGQEELTELLFSLEMGSFIPEELYEIIAQLYTFVLETQEKL